MEAESQKLDPTQHQFIFTTDAQNNVTVKVLIKNRHDLGELSLDDPRVVRIPWMRSQAMKLKKLYERRGLLPRK